MTRSFRGIPALGGKHLDNVTMRIASKPNTTVVSGVNHAQSFNMRQPNKKNSPCEIPIDLAGVTKANGMPLCERNLTIAQLYGGIVVADVLKKGTSKTVEGGFHYLEKIAPDIGMANGWVPQKKLWFLG
ncbi:MAG: hypothetical protein H3C30_03225 [Candidatus Hydrogenedentes bacterium]|nr:hypothetical protein [Candidatus Hydrogenedentota bacterium]